ncbi:MAG: nuclear transport factor 2 family protein [Proteobacteria bacterium]|nr:nuclear transport factor 2 family protein [Pseudomonadota bacterium]
MSATTTSDPIDTWHRVLKERNVQALDTLLAPDAVFHSPVVHTPQAGRAITKAYLAAALQVLGNDSFRYVREVRQGNDAVLEFELELEGVHMNGVDMIRWNDQGQITDFKVMVRPLKAINLLHQKMAAMLQAKSANG